MLKNRGPSTLRPEVLLSKPLEDHRSFHVHLHQCHLFHNLYLTQKVIDWQARQEDDWATDSAKCRER